MASLGGIQLPSSDTTLPRFSTFRQHSIWPVPSPAATCLAYLEAKNGAATTPFHDSWLLWPVRRTPGEAGRRNRRHR